MPAKEKRVDDVELLLDRKRPGVKQRLQLGRHVEITGTSPEEYIRGEERRGDGALPELLQVMGQEQVISGKRCE